MKAPLFTIGLLLASTIAFAQADEQAPGNERADSGKRIMKQLDLSEEQREQMREIRAQGGSREDMQAVMTDEQRQQAEKLQRQHGEERLKRMQEHLALSDDQVTEIKEIRERGGSREEVHAVLTEEQQEKVAQQRKKHGGKKKPAPAADE
jgi:Spy/CpxP family protein refolding chaperone